MSKIHFSEYSGVEIHEILLNLFNTVIDEEYLLENVPGGVDGFHRVQAFYESLYNSLGYDEATEKYDDFQNTYLAIGRTAYLQGIEHGIRLITAANNGTLAQEIIKTAY